MGWNRFEHDFVEEDAAAEKKEPPAITPADVPVKFKSESAATVWNAKVDCIMECKGRL